jgi:hypothetical protein
MITCWQHYLYMVEVKLIPHLGHPAISCWSPKTELNDPCSMHSHWSMRPSPTTDARASIERIGDIHNRIHIVGTEDARPNMCIGTTITAHLHRKVPTPSRRTFRRWIYGPRQVFHLALAADWLILRSDSDADRAESRTHRPCPHVQLFLALVHALSEVKREWLRISQ